MIILVQIPRRYSCRFLGATAAAVCTVLAEGAGMDPDECMHAISCTFMGGLYRPPPTCVCVSRTDAASGLAQSGWRPRSSCVGASRRVTPGVTYRELIGNVWGPPGHACQGLFLWLQLLDTQRALPAWHVAAHCLLQCSQGSRCGALHGHNTAVQLQHRLAELDRDNNMDVSPPVWVAR